jgi:hypothetical protein
MYYKTYSYWSTKCQAKYTTTYVAEQGSLIGNVAFLSFPLFLTTVSFYGLVFIAQSLFLILQFTETTSKSVLNVFTWIELVGIMFLVVFYSGTLLLQ